MTELDAIKQRLIEVQPRWTKIQFTADDVRWLIAEVERLRADLDASNQLGIKSSDRARNLQWEVERLRSAAVNQPRTIHITGSIRGGDGKADGSGGGDVMITGDLVAEVERLRAIIKRFELILVYEKSAACIWCKRPVEDGSIAHTDDCEWVQAMGGGG